MTPTIVRSQAQFDHLIPAAGEERDHALAEPVEAIIDKVHTSLKHIGR